MQLVADNLTLARGGRSVVSGLSLNVAAGEALVLTGPNGAGKTTLLRALAGLLLPSAGTIRIDGADADTPVGELAHYVGHRSAVKPSLTVARNLHFWSDYLDPDVDASARRERMHGTLAAIGLAHLADVPVGLLSAGQTRRVGLARLLVAHRPVWLLDEPTVSLDAAATEWLAGAIRAHVTAGGIAVVATHLPLGLDGARFLRLGSAGDDASTSTRPAAGGA